MLLGTRVRANPFGTAALVNRAKCSLVSALRASIGFCGHNSPELVAGQRALAVIAGVACRNQIGLLVASTATDRNNVVKCRVPARVLWTSVAPHIAMAIGTPPPLILTEFIQFRRLTAAPNIFGPTLRHNLR